MKTENMLREVLSSHQKDKNDFDHTQTTITSIIGVLQSINRNLNDVELLKIVIPMAIEELKIELEKCKLELTN